MTQIKEILSPAGCAARPGYRLKPEWITIHNTANTGVGAGAESHGTYLRASGKNKTVSYHYAVDNSLIARIIPDNEVSWHAGDGANGTGNRKSLSIEICENPESDLLAATNNAAELTAHLMHDYCIPIAKVVQHNYWSGKNCPNRIRKGDPYSWNTFIERVQGFYSELYDNKHADTPNTENVSDAIYRVQVGAFRNKKNAENYAKELKGKGVNGFVSGE